MIHKCIYYLQVFLPKNRKMIHLPVTHKQYHLHLQINNVIKALGTKGIVVKKCLILKQRPSKTIFGSYFGRNDDFINSF